MIQNKTILLTGAGGGIGSAIATSLSAAGAKLIFVGLHLSELEALNETLGGQHYSVEANIASKEGRATIVSFCQQCPDKLDILVNCAGIGQFSLFDSMDEDHISAIININLTSTILLTQELLAILLSRPQAQIINIGSIFGSIGYPASTVYCASKFGIRGFSEALNRELMDSPIKVRYFAPRATKAAINNDHVMAMNNELGTKMDSGDDVANEFIQFLQSTKLNAYLGWPEKLFVRVNSLFPSVVGKSIFKQLAIIKRFAKEK